MQTMKDRQETIKALSRAWHKLTAKLAQKELELNRLENCSGSGYSRRLPRLNRLRDEIESLKVRLDRCERLMEKSQ